MIQCNTFYVELFWNIIFGISESVDKSFTLINQLP